MICKIKNLNEKGTLSFWYSCLRKPNVSRCSKSSTKDSHYGDNKVDSLYLTVWQTAQWIHILILGVKTRHFVNDKITLTSTYFFHFYNVKVFLSSSRVVAFNFVKTKRVEKLHICGRCNGRGSTEEEGGQVYGWHHKVFLK